MGSVLNPQDSTLREMEETKGICVYVCVHVCVCVSI